MFSRWALALTFLLVGTEHALARGGRGGGGRGGGRSVGRVGGRAPQRGAGFSPKARSNSAGEPPKSRGGTQVVNHHHHHSRGGPFSGFGTYWMMSSFMGGGNRGLRQEQNRLQDQLGTEQTKPEQLEAELAESKAKNSEMEERMSALERK